MPSLVQALSHGGPSVAVTTRVYLVGGEGMRAQLDRELGDRHVDPSQRTEDTLQELTRDLEHSRAQRMSIDMGL